MKATRFLFLVYVPLLVLFFWRTSVFWMNDRYGDLEGGDVLMYLGLIGVEVITLIMIALNTKMVRRENRSIHNICLLWEIVMLVVMMYNHASIANCAKCLAWPLFFESAYLFVKARARNFTFFLWIYCILVAIGAFFFFQAMTLLGYGRQSNMIYFLLLPISVLLCTNNPKRRIIVLILASFLAILSMKRSVMLAMALTWSVIGIKYLFMSRKRGVAIILSVFLVFAAVASYSIVDRVSGGRLSYRFDNDEDDVTNGRAAIYVATWEMIANSSIGDLLLGHGHNAVRKDSMLNVSAHNDWMEILYDYGLLCFLLYLGLWIYVVRQWIYHVRKGTIFFMPYTMSLSLLAVMSFVSQLVVYVSYFLYLVMLWGMIAAAKENADEHQRIYARRLFSIT